MNKKNVYMNIKTTEQLVKQILEKYPISRSDDFRLYGYVLYYNGISLEQSLKNFLKNAKKDNITPFATVTKCRRKLQSQYPELIGENKENRLEMQSLMVDFNKEKNNGKFN